ncbi:MAG: LamG domain-containing protein, partial [Planctomycetes bacterium]|nr:LamG domain-containing protein [Planctomycetota bacterium]
ERWPWPAASNGGFVEGALKRAPLNRGFEFTGQRRLAFNGASEGTRTVDTYNPDPRSVHWGLEAGTLEFWCRPSWDAGDGLQHVFFQGTAYGHRLQSRLRKLDGEGGSQLEFRVADADGEARTIRGPAPMRAGKWHHLAATWDFPAAHLQLFVDGKLVAAEGPGEAPWASSLAALDEARDKGIGITPEDRRSLPMQAFIGGDPGCREERSAEAVLDEFRISDAVRYSGPFTPVEEEFEVDEHTRALFHFENERHGVHDSDDRFVRGYLACELHPQEETAVLEVLGDGAVQRRDVLVKPHASAELFQANRAENRMKVTRPFEELPDPRFVEYRERQVERVVTGEDDGFQLTVEGDFEPLMRSVTFELGDQATGAGSPLPRWRANENVVPFSVEGLAATLGAGARDDA